MQINSPSTGKSVLLVIPWSPNLPAGVSVVVRHLKTEFARAGRKNTVVVSSWQAKQLTIDSEENLCFRFALIGALGWNAYGKTILTAAPRLFRTWNLLRKLNIGAVNFHYPGFDSLGIVVLRHLRLFDGRIVFSFHGTDVPEQLTGISRALWQFLLTNVDSVTACSNALAVTISETFNISLKRIVVIGNGVDSSQFFPAAKQKPLPYFIPKRFIVSVGSYIPRKGHNLLLKAFSVIASDFPHISLVIVGSDGPERLSLQTEAARLGLTDRLFCLTNQSPEHVSTVLANALLCVQPSRSEPFGMAVIEAGASGVPVLATAVGGHAELLRHNKTGYLFPCDSAESCIAGLRLMLNDPDYARNLAEHFRKEVLHFHSWTSSSDAYLRLL